MSPTIWTPAGLSPSLVPLKDDCWRAVEAQHFKSTMKLVDSPGEQKILEEEIEQTKPNVPEECRHLDFLLYTPFRYDGPYPRGSRFRREGFTAGVYYASSAPRTAIAEMAFIRLLFYAESPGTPYPANPSEYTVFSVPLATSLSVDLTAPPLDQHSELWHRLADYEDCQRLADVARACSAEVIQYESVRDPHKSRNYAVLSCRAFAASKPQHMQSWHMQLHPKAIWARCEAPKFGMSFDLDLFMADPRLRSLTPWLSA